MSSLNKKPQEIVKVSWFPKDLDLVKFKTNNRKNSFFDSLAQDCSNKEYEKAVRLNVLDEFLSKLQNDIAEKALGPSRHTPEEIIKIVKKKIKEEKNIQEVILKTEAEFIFPDGSDIREIMVFFKKDPNIRYRVLINKSRLKLKPNSLYFALAAFIQYLTAMTGKAWLFSLITKSIEDLNTGRIKNNERKKICDGELEKLSFVSSKTPTDPYEILKDITHKYSSLSTAEVKFVCTILEINILEVRIDKKNEAKIRKIISWPENDYVILFYNETNNGNIVYEPGGIIDKHGKIKRKLNIETHKEILETLETLEI